MGESRSRDNVQWIRSARADLLLVIAPPFVASAAVLAMPGWLARVRETPPWAWLMLVLGIDVAHVYGTLFKTYFDPARRRKHRAELIVIPAMAWAAGALLYSLGELTFWRALAYLAIFHFIRQQYGFVRIYSRKERASPASRRLDAAAVYAATLYPLLYWHTHLPRNFNWFMDGDLVYVPGRWGLLADRVGFALYAAILGAFALREAARALRNPRAVNYPKNLIVLGTALSWYLGIVIFNGDLAFTLTNVVSHGIPYLGLVWLTGATTVRGSRARGLRAAAIFVGIILLGAYLEEGLWDGLVWRDHPQFFSWLYGLPYGLTSAALTVLVPLLSLPQVTHYVLDGLIWKTRDPALLEEMR